jgi:O-antigen/teichoic acid export membrane protein
LTLRFDPALAREALGFGVKSYAQNLTGHMHYRLDVYLLALFLPPAQVAFYTVATSIAEVVFYIPDSVGTVLFPRLSTEPVENIHKLTAEVARHTMLVTALVSMAMLAAGGFLIPVIYGQDYRAAVAPFFLLLPGVLAMAVYKVLTRNYSSRNRQQVPVFTAILALALNIVLNLYFIPIFGIIGAALASMISYAVSAVVLLFLFNRETGISLREILIVHPADLIRYRQVWSRFWAWLSIRLPVAGNAKM